jgi:C1A family cysteine protease
MTKIATINKELASHSLGWTAEENHITEMDEEQQNSLLGYAPDPASGEMSLALREQHASMVANAMAAQSTETGVEMVPAVVDLRSYNGHNYITPVKDQSSCGSCVAFGSLAAVEGAMCFVGRNANLQVDLSENHLFNCIARSQGRNCSIGWWVAPALTALRDQGVVDEPCSPYSPADQQCVLCAGWPSRLTRIRGFAQINSVAAMKDSLTKFGPLVACFSVYSDFFAYSSGVYRRTPSSVLRGGHCICVVGYDDFQGAWICKNSWRDTWGEGGFFKIAYGECGIDATMWSIEVGAVPSQTLAPLHRYWNPSNGDHFYTTNWGELGNGRYGWGYEGVQCDIAPTSQPGLIPLFRYWNAQAGDHFYTTNWNELGAGRYGWAYEGVQGYVSPTPQSGMIPLYRYWNASISDHFYTTNWPELGGGAYGWGYEGIQCYVWPASVTSGGESIPETFRIETELAVIGAAAPGGGGLLPSASFTIAGVESIPSSFTTGWKTTDVPGSFAPAAPQQGKCGCGNK